MVLPPPPQGVLGQRLLMLPGPWTGPARCQVDLWYRLSRAAGTVEGDPVQQQQLLLEMLSEEERAGKLLLSSWLFLSSTFLSLVFVSSCWTWPLPSWYV